MNIDQLLSLEKSEKMNTTMHSLLTDSLPGGLSQKYFDFYNKANQVGASSAHMTLDFLNNCSNGNTANSSSGLLKTANQFALNTNLIENLLIKNRTIKNDKAPLSTSSSPFDFTSSPQLHTEANKEVKKNLDDNSYRTYFNQLLNQSKSPSYTESNSKKLDTLNSQIQQHQQNLAAAFAACYTDNNSKATGNDRKFTEAMINATRSQDGSPSSLGWNNNSANYLNGGNEKSNSINQNTSRPTSQNSSNCSVSSMSEMNADYDDELISENIKRPKQFNDTSETRSSVTKEYKDLTVRKSNSIPNEKNESDEERSDSPIELTNERTPPALYARMGLIGLEGLNETIFDEYQDWAQRTYGDSAKTKTVTKKKYKRIVKILNGEEPNNVENSKFRFWVKSKGFRLGTFDDHQYDTSNEVLYVPCVKSSANRNSSQIGNSRNKNHSFVYKKVAVVENFFQIIYSVHVEMEGKAGKHAGQKRTYRAVAEMYAFLPREAVTRFLMFCKDCQKRMHLQIPLSKNSSTESASLATRQPASSSNKNSSSASSNNLKELFKTASLDANTLTSLANNLNTIVNTGRTSSCHGSSKSNPKAKSNKTHKNSRELDLLPISTAYLKQMNRLAKNESLLTDQDLNSLIYPNNYLINTLNGNQTFGSFSSNCRELNDSNSIASIDEEEDRFAGSRVEMDVDFDMLQIEKSDEKQLLKSSPNHTSINDLANNHTHENEQKNQENKRKLDDKFDGAKKFKMELLSDDEEEEIDEQFVEENDTDGNNHIKLEEDEEDVFEFKDTKDSSLQEDEDDDEEEEDNRSTTDLDPDRLKAFNMFVRLLADSNLDRSVPISRQPKEKIQAIIESCKRQFPELQSRSRKRIRTYLKSCRRTKKIQNLRKLGSHCPTDYELKQLLNDEAGSSSDFRLILSKGTINQPVYHLNSTIAEKILADAFDNEVLNIRRINDGLRPLSANGQTVGHQEQSMNSNPFKMYARDPFQTLNSNLISRLINQKNTRLEDIDRTLNKLNKMTNNSLDNLRVAASNKERSLVSLLAKTNNQVDLTALANNTSGQLKELLSIEQLITNSSPFNSLAIDVNKSNSELVPKTKSNESLLSNLYNLSASELIAIKQLITGYRESAAFLLKSAQELEFLLFQQHN